MIGMFWYEVKKDWKAFGSKKTVKFDDFLTTSAWQISVFLINLKNQMDDDRTNVFYRGCSLDLHSLRN